MQRKFRTEQGSLSIEERQCAGHQSDHNPLAGDLGSGLQWRFSNRKTAWRPPTDVYETGSQVVVCVEAAGMLEEDFSVTFKQDCLQIQGVRREPRDVRGYQQMEILYGEFITEVRLTSPIDTDSIVAQYRDGFLKVTLEVRKPHEVAVHET
ncbi:Hsp20/alpha crystallin family protein [Sulfidibacter corallicola]|uniref:Hsp20/alpha crystallin family protein n=1 Tax=Sulfidibacter corallicola TaxID=2818388 RepID=A0A8A4TN91_SULCO|nr:Hsp20/alpha crystallin family protein [Sulfidibacter corallicola]QTD51436.1 Hsp20/alpha crystallin family protein [Sulfidibacter corallicola]